MALASNKVKKRCTYVNEEQKSLLNLCVNNPELQSGKFSTTFTYKYAQKLWEKVTVELHEIPGAQKEWKQWRKTWQDMRSSTKAKNALIKNYAKATGGGPASSQVLSETDQNVLALMGTTVVEGHKTVQESNVLMENFPMQYSQDITQQCVSKQSSSSQNYHCSRLEENSPERNFNNDNRKSLTKRTTALETPINVVNNASHISVTLILKSTAIKKGVKRISAAQRYDKSIEQTEKLAKISQEDSDLRKSYYAEKLKLYTKELALKEKDIITKQNICTLLEQLVKKSN